MAEQPSVAEFLGPEPDTRPSASEFLGDPGQANAAQTRPYIDTVHGVVGSPFGEIGGRASLDLLPSVEEGGRKFWAGIHQLGASIADVAKDFWSPDLPKTPQQKADWWETRTKAVTSEENIRAAQQAAVDKSHGVDLDNRDALASAVQAAPWLAAGPLAGSEGYFTGITKQAALGVAQQASSFSAAPSSLSDIAVGAVAQTVLPAVTSSLAAGKNFIANRIQKYLQEGNTDKAFQAAKEVLGEKWADGVSLARRTGIPWLASLEAGTNDSRIVNNYAKSADDTVSRAAEVLRQDIPVGQGLDGAFMEVRAKATSQLNASQATRQALWTKGMEEFTTLAGDAPLALPNFGAKVKELSAAQNNLLANPGKYNISAGAEAAITDFKTAIYPAIDPAVAKADAQLQRLIDQTQNPTTKEALQRQMSTGGGPPKPQIKLAQASDALTGLRKMGEDADPKVQALAGQLRDAFEADLTTAAANGDPQSLKALSQLKEMRAEYGRQAQLESRMRESATFKMVGIGQGLDQAKYPSTEDMWVGFAKLSPERQAGVVDFMTKESPNALAHLKQKSIDMAIQGTNTINAARDSQQSLKNLAAGLFDADHGMVARNPGLWSPEELKKLDGIKSGLTVLANTSPKGTAGTASGIAAVTNFAYNKAADIAAKSVVRLMLGGAGSELFTNPKAMELIMTVGKTSGVAQNMARVALAKYMTDQYGQVVGQ